MHAHDFFVVVVIVIVPIAVVVFVVDRNFGTVSGVHIVPD